MKGVVDSNGQRAVVLAQILSSEAAAVRPQDVLNRVCEFIVDRLKVSGCALILVAGQDSAETVSSAGARGAQIAELQFSLGEGPCLDAYRSGVPVLVSDLAATDGRWPAFSSAAAALGVRAEFSIPLHVGAASLGSLDLSCLEPRTLEEAELTHALIAADIATDALLAMQSADGGAGLMLLLDTGEMDRLVVHQATGMVAVMLDVDTSTALARLRAHAFRTGKSMDEIATDVVNRRVKFDE